MDVTKEKTLEHEILDKLDAEFNDTVTISSSGYYNNFNGWSDPQYGAIPPLTVTNINGNINGMSYSNTNINNTSLSAGGYTIGTGIGINTAGHVWTTGTTGTTGPYTVNSPYTMNQSGKVHITGENADLVIGEKSMRDWMERVEERLNILTPNTKLETEWEELRALGEQYRQLEQHIKDKQATWDRLKAMPPPVTE
jgi:hypothetical protein